MKNIVIIGGGKSINSFPKKDINNTVENTLTIGCNLAGKYFKTTCNLFLDQRVYLEYQTRLSNSPCIGLFRNTTENQHKEVLWIKHKPVYSRLNEEGMYIGTLTGTAAISLAIYLLNGEGNIYLLGYDWISSKGEESHFHKEDNGYFESYGKPYLDLSPEQEFEGFKKEEGIHIFNVNPSSLINCFPKITYREFINSLKERNLFYSQDTLKQYVISKVKPVSVNI